MAELLLGISIFLFFKSNPIFGLVICIFEGSRKLSNANGSNIFRIMGLCSRHGKLE